VISLAVLIQYTSVTDRQTDAVRRLVSRGKSCQNWGQCQPAPSIPSASHSCLTCWLFCCSLCYVMTLQPRGHSFNLPRLHCALSLAGLCIVIGPVCGFVCVWLWVCLFVCLFVCGSVTTITRNYVHRSSPNCVCR